MCRVDSQIFQWRPHFFIQIIVLAACLQKTGGFARNWLLAHAKFAAMWLAIHNASAFSKPNIQGPSAE
jgi:hypothetical protein